MATCSMILPLHQLELILQGKVTLFSFKNEAHQIIYFQVSKYVQKQQIWESLNSNERVAQGQPNSN